MTRYEDVNAVNFSTLKWARTSLLHYRYWSEHQTPVNDAMRKGDAVHAAVFEPDRFLTDFVAWTRRTKSGKMAPRTGKAWLEFTAEHEGKTVLTIEQMERATLIGDAVRANSVARELLDDPKGMAEQPLVWEDDSGLLCKGKPDWVAPTMGDVDDLKVLGRGVSAWSFANTMQRMGYYLQVAFYRRGYHHLHGVELTPAFICVEETPPNDVAVHELGEQSLEVADQELDELLERVAQCQETNEWPGQYPRRNIIDLPKWRLTEDAGIGDLDLEL